MKGMIILSEIRQTGIVLSASPYKFTDEKTGRTLEGVTIYYLNATDLNPKRDENGQGVKPSKASIPIDKLKNIPCAPAVYSLIYKIAPGADMKLAIKLSNVEYLADCFGYMIEQMTVDEVDHYFNSEVLQRIKSQGEPKDKGNAK